MKATVRTKLGNAEYVFEIEEKSDIDTLHKIAILGNPPTTCDVCNVDDASLFSLTSNKDSEGNTYINVACACGAKAKLGQYKSQGYFWHKYEKYVKKST